MRSVLLVVCLAIACLCAYVGAQPQAQTAKLSIHLSDPDGRALTGLVRIFPKGKQEPLKLELMDRLMGLVKSKPPLGWYVVRTVGGEVELPRTALRIEALSGLETGLATMDLDLARETPKAVTLTLPFLFQPEEKNLVAGNTHLHLQKLGKEAAVHYLWSIPAADRLKVCFVSYLERHNDDKDYDSNAWPIGDMDLRKETGVLFNNGEEHRHNFEAYGQGYGHVMLLNIKQLVKPVSLGPGITGAGFDDTPLRPGIDDARKQGGTIIWCHNTSGYEATPEVLAGKLDALNVFDGSRTGAFEDRYYRFLNIGQRLPISTGTDWFMYDFSRVYAKVPGPLTVPSWLDALKAGRTVATNGPLLALSLDGKEIGDVLSLDKPRTIKIEATGIGRKDFQELQLVHNGKVIKTQATELKDGGHRARLVHELRIDQPAWLAVRIQSQTKNEFDLPLFAHSSPTYIDFEGKRVFDLEAARALLKQLEEARADIRAKAKFSNAGAGAKVVDLYDQATEDLRKRVNARGG
jgi:hypothetical protein